MSLNTEQLLSFVALVQTGSIHAAAKLRHLTQPAISNQLKYLQQDTGLQLYQRDGRGVKVTPTGEAFYQYALGVQQALQDTASFIQQAQGLDAGKVYIAASQTIANALLPRVLPAFRKLVPHVELSVGSYNSQYVFEHMDAYDFGLVEQPLPTGLGSSCHVQHLGQDHIVVVMRHDHPLAQYQALDVSHLREHRMVWREQGSGTRAVLEQVFFTRNQTLPHIDLCLGGVSAVLEAVRQGLGIGVVSQYCLPTGEHVLTTRPLNPTLSRPMSLLLPHHATPLARKCATYLASALQAELQHETKA
ncbi:LysR family transcriptional regulator [Ghiorsea bivora]|uniref:LysR family transcriptional regulator n=1 Tax=Ghiorsea bivora TaxID=1485545 RepID=UPI000570E9F7|nr:LysR family transcriptional regulator [Ghiorsea bivora]